MTSSLRGDDILFIIVLYRVGKFEPELSKILDWVIASSLRAILMAINRGTTRIILGEFC